MKAWAQKRKREMEVVGENELAVMFDLVVRLCELDEQLSFCKTNGQSLHLRSVSNSWGLENRYTASGSAIISL